LTGLVLLFRLQSGGGDGVSGLGGWWLCVRRRGLSRGGWGRGGCLGRVRCRGVYQVYFGALRAEGE
jgi:hypothetical protein